MGTLGQRVLQIFCEETRRLWQTGARWTREEVRVVKVVRLEILRTRWSLYNAPVTSQQHRDVVLWFDSIARYFYLCYGIKSPGSNPENIVVFGIVQLIFILYYYHKHNLNGDRIENKDDYEGISSGRDIQNAYNESATKREYITTKVS